jgi:predicted ATPase/serine phosphatase RsbU (regulator of sigma subunit)/tRNA A-37 threonylcarbamoyl transferase component Bud32
LFKIDLPVRIQKYNIHRQIAETDLSQVYEATIDDQSRCCLKVVKSKSEEVPTLDQIRFRTEASVLSQIKSPQVVQVYEIGEIQGHGFISLEWVQGKPLSSFIQGISLTQTESLQIVSQVCLGLVAVHGKGLLHLDIKPDNIMISQDADGGRSAKIVDFGFAGNSGVDITGLMGTPRYIPPEQSGLVKWSVDVQADLYSLGVTLFEMITGRLPFDDPDPRIVLQEHLEKNPPLPSVLNSEVHPLVEKIVMKLLAKSPFDRYQSALSLHSDLQVAIERVASSNPSGELELDKLSRQGLHLGKVFVGRKAELSFLFDLYQKANSEKIQVCFVSGVSGLGKTALLSELQNRVLISGAHLAYGKCQQFSRGLPFFGIGEAFNSFLAKLETYPEASQNLIKKRIIDTVGDLKSDLLRVAPGFGKIFGDVQVASAAADERAIQKMKEAIVRVISSIAHKGQPLMILIDDLQWADYSSIDLISYLADLQVDGAIYFIGTFRPEEVYEDHALRKLLDRHDGQGQVKKLELAPLSTEEMAEMVARSLGQEILTINQGLVQLVGQRSRGNPFYINEILRTLLKEKVVSVGEKRVEFDANRAEGLRLPDSLIDIVLARIQGLPDQTQQLLSAASILGSPVAAQDLAKILNRDPFAIESEIRSLADENIFRKIPAGYAFYHDKVLEACLLLFDEGLRVKTHLSCIELLQARKQDESVVFALAEHAIRAGHDGHIIKFCSLAGEQAFQKNSLSDALKYFGKVLEKVDSSDSSRLPIQLKVCDIYTAMGNYTAAESVLTELLAKGAAHTLKVRVTANNKLAETMQRQGKYAEALQRLNDSLAIIKAPLFKRNFKFAIAVDRAMIAVLSHIKNVSPSPDRTERLTLLCDTLRRLWMVMVIVDNKSMLHISYRFLRVAIQLGRPIEMATAHQYLALTVCNTPSPNFKAGLMHSQRAMDLGQSIGAHEIVAGALIRIAAFLTWQAKSREAISYSERARETLLAVGNMWDLGNAIIFSYFSNRTLGKLTEALSSAQGLLRLGERTGSKGLVSSGSSKIADVLFLQGNLVEGEKNLELAIQIAEKNGLKFDLFQAMKVAGFSRLHRGQLNEARGFFARAIKLNEEAKGSFFTAYIQEAYLGWVESYLKDKVQLEQLLRTDSTEIKAIRKYLIQAAGIEKHFRDYAYVLKLEAILAFREGDSKTFNSKFEQSIMRYSAQERPIELAITELDYGSLLNELSDSQAKSFLRKAHNKFTELKIPHFKKAAELALKEAGEHVAAEAAGGVRSEKVAQTLLEVSLAALSSIDKIEQSRALLDKTIELFEAERALLFLKSDAGELEFLLGRAAMQIDISQPDGFSRTILSKVQTTQAPLVAANTEEGVLLGSHSVIAKNLKSMMAAPILVRGSLIGVLYLDNRIEKKLYMSEDGEFLMAISAQIGALLQISKLASVEIEKKTIEKDLELTAAVQMLLLPEKRDFTQEGVLITSYYQPSNISGGDWWWYSTDPQGNLQIYLGDVTGHGPGSAMITALVAGALRATSSPLINRTAVGGDATGEILRVTSSDLRSVAKGDYLMTMNVVLINPKTREGTFWFAAGTVVIVLKQTGEAQIFHVQSKPLGIEAESFGSEKTKLEAGDRILTFTDGITEQMDLRGSQFGERRLIKTMKEAKAMPLADAREHIVKSVHKFRGEVPMADDMCFVLVEMS